MSWMMWMIEVLHASTRGGLGLDHNRYRLRRSPTENEQIHHDNSEQDTALGEAAQE